MSSHFGVFLVPTSSQRFYLLRNGQDLTKSNGRSKNKVGFGDISIDESTNTISRINDGSSGNYGETIKPKRKPLMKTKKIEFDEVRIDVSLTVK